MAEILIQGSETETAANELTAAIQDIFGIEPLRTTHAPGTRTGLEVAAVILALPPAMISVADLAARARLGERLRRLVDKAAALCRTTRATILIDPGDGRHIPLEEANRDAILAALQAVEQRLRK